MRRCVGQRTVGYCAKSESGEMLLLQVVQPGWDMWSVGMIGPDLFWRVRHGSVVQPEEGVSVECGCGGTRKIKEEGPRSSIGGEGRGSGEYKYSKVQYNIRVH